MDNFDESFDLELTRQKGTNNWIMTLNKTVCGVKLSNARLMMVSEDEDGTMNKVAYALELIQKQINETIKRKLSEIGMMHD